MDALSWLVIADDLTGACDCGAAFARAGRSVSVLLHPWAELPEVQAGAVWAISANSRGLPPGEAERAVELALGRVLASLRPEFLYHKIDSTLRGHPGLELNAIMRVAMLDRALVCPAFPRQGRVVRGG